STGLCAAQPLCVIVPLPTQSRAFRLLAVRRAYCRKAEPRSCCVVDTQLVGELVGAPLQWFTQHLFDQPLGAALGVPRCTTPQPDADALFGFVEVREVVSLDQGVIGPGVVMGQQRAPAVCED